MTIRLSSIGLASVLAISCAPSFAQVSVADWSVTGNASLVSDYRFRGISQTNKGPAFQGGFDLAHSSGFYLGNWNSNVDSGFLYGANLEMDFYGGFRGALDAFTYDVGGLYYYYPGSEDPDASTGELYIAGGWGPVSAKYSYAVTDFFGVEDSSGSWYLDAKLAYPIDKLTLIARVGYQSLEVNAVEKDGSEVDSVTDWQLGVTYDLSGWILGASYIGTNREFLGAAHSTTGKTKTVSGDTLVLSVSKSF